MPKPSPGRYLRIDESSPANYDLTCCAAGNTLYPMDLTHDPLNLAITDSAVEQIKKLIARDSRGGCGLRIAVTDGGCSGFSYKLDFDNQQRPDDLVLERNGVKILVDSGSVPYLAGIVIDFVGGLHGGGFKFTNPNATATCGCGTSFSA
jgi:iron-sulfur cluster assembly accessory protein